MAEETQVELEQLLTNIRNQFYTDVPEKKYFQDLPALQRAVTWPATWLQHRGVTWPAEKYFAEIRAKLQDIKRHGATGEMKYFPGYLMKVLQDHFAHNAEEICDAGKQAFNAFDLALGKAVNAARLAEVRKAEETINVLAEAHRVLATRKRSAKVQLNTFQPELF